MLELRSSDFDHGGDGDAPHQDAADDMGLGGTSHGDAFQWHGGAAVGGSARPHLQNRLAPDAEAAQIDGRSGSGAAGGSRRSRSDRNPLPWRRAVSYFLSDNGACKLTLTLAEVIQ